MKRLIVALIVLVMVVLINAEVTYVAAIAENTSVYERRTTNGRDTPIFTVGTVDRLQVVETGKQNLKIMKSTGETGWIKKRLVKAVPWRGMVFENVAVMGYLENPTPILIAVNDDSPEEMIELNRSFKDALKENIDRETVCRQMN